MRRTHLFDAELQYQPGMSPITSDGEGELVGSGDGVLHGDRLAGTFGWTLFEQPGALVCTMNPILAVVTGDGAELRVEGRGYGRRDRADGSLWRVAATLLFETDDERYAWLTGGLAVWEGEFDADQHRARYRAYLAAEPTP